MRHAPDEPDREETVASAHDEEVLRREAIKQVGRKRRFHRELITSVIGMAILVVIWAMTEYHNAGGWPTQGFSQSSGIHDTWNVWIAYPIVAWVLILAARAWHVFGHKPITESEITHEMDRLAGRH